MSRRLPDSKPSAATQAADIAPARLHSVLAAGLNRVSIDAKAKQTAKKSPKDALKPSFKSDKDSISVFEKAVQVALRKSITTEAEIEIISECFEFMETFLPSNGSLDCTATIASVTAVRYLDHSGLIPPDFDTEDFYAVAKLYVSYTTFKSEDSSQTAIDAFFGDKDLGQNKRAVLNDVDTRTLLTSYFQDLRNFVTEAKAGNYGPAKELIKQSLPVLVDLAYRMASNHAGSAQRLDEDLDGLYTALQQGAKLATPWLPSVGQAASLLPRSLLAPVVGWFDYKVKVLETFSEGVKAEFWDRYYAYANIIFLRDVRGGLARHAVVGSSTTLKAATQNWLDWSLRQLWVMDRVFLASNPLARIGYNLLLIMARAVIQSKFYEVKSIARYVSLNSRKEAAVWKKELDTAADLKRQLTPVDRQTLKRLTGTALFEWRAAHMKLSDFVKKKPKPSTVAQAIGIPFSPMLLAQSGIFAFRTQRWRSQINESRQDLDKAIEKMRKVQTDYFDENDENDANTLLEAATRVQNNILEEGLIFSDGEGDGEDDADPAWNAIFGTG